MTECGYHWREFSQSSSTPAQPGQCIFCRLVAGEIPAAGVYEVELTSAFMDLSQTNPGHVLVAVKRHAAILQDGEQALARFEAVYLR